jgi:hypothetical protein
MPIKVFLERRQLIDRAIQPIARAGISRREETAAMRSQIDTTKVLADNPPLTPL